MSSMKAHTEAAADAPAPPIHVGDPESTGQEGLRVLDIVGALLDQPFAAQVWILSGAVFVWMGSSGAKPSLSTLSTAISTRYSPMPLITPLVGAPEMEEQQIAQRLARRTGRQCFVSCQLPDHVPELFGYVERQIIARLVAEGVIPAKPGA